MRLCARQGCATSRGLSDRQDKEVKTDLDRLCAVHARLPGLLADDDKGAAILEHGELGLSALGSTHLVCGVDCRIGVHGRETGRRVVTRDWV